jgi:hypothetical protein
MIDLGKKWGDMTNKLAESFEAVTRSFAELGQQLRRASRQARRKAARAGTRGRRGASGASGGAVSGAVRPTVGDVPGASRGGARPAMIKPLLRLLQLVQRTCGLYHAPRRHKRPFATMARTIVPRRVHRDPTEDLCVAMGVVRGRPRGERSDWPATGGRWA